MEYTIADTHSSSASEGNGARAAGYVTVGVVWSHFSVASASGIADTFRARRVEMMTIERRGIDKDLAVVAILSSVANVVVGDVRLVGLCPLVFGSVGIAALTGIVRLVVVERVAVVVDEAKVRQKMINAHTLVTTVPYVASVDGRIDAFIIGGAWPHVTTFVGLSVTVVVLEVAAEVEGFR